MFQRKVIPAGIFKVQAFQEDRKKVKKGISFLDCLTVEVEGAVFFFVVRAQSICPRCATTYRLIV